MSGTPALPLDLTGQAPANLIENEVHTLDSNTGRIFPLGYGGFYSDSLVIYRGSDPTPLIPGIDFVAIAPNDPITKQTGLESMSVVALTQEIGYEDDYTVSYQAVGGEYSTNVQVIQDVIDAIAASVTSVEWGMILNKPEEFNTAPHLIDFRKDLYGFEGLIESLAEIHDKMGNVDTAQIAAVLTHVNTGLQSYKASVDSQIAALTQSVQTLQSSMPNMSNYLAGSPAAGSDVIAGTATSKYLRASNMDSVRNKVLAVKQETNAALVENTSQEFIYVSANLNASGVSGDNTVPNVALPYFIETRTVGSQVMQFALSQHTGAYHGYAFQRVRGVTKWTRTDATKIGNRLPVHPGDMTGLGWDDDNEDFVATPRTIKLFMEKNANFILPVGSVIAYAGQTLDATVQDYFSLCVGASLQDAEYPELKGIIGTVFGSAAPGTFRVPDLRDEHLRGWPGTRIGTPNTGVGFGTWIDSQNKEHTHKVKEGTSNPSTGGTAQWLTSGDDYTRAIQHYSDTLPEGGAEARVRAVFMNYIIRKK